MGNYGTVDIQSGVLRTIPYWTRSTNLFDIVRHIGQNTISRSCIFMSKLFIFNLEAILGKVLWLELLVLQLTFHLVVVLVILGL